MWRERTRRHGDKRMAHRISEIGRAGHTSEQPRPSVILENLSVAHVSAKRVDALVSALVHHLENRRAALGGRREESRAKRVASEQRGIEADVLGVRLDDIGDRLRGQPSLPCRPS
jgi:hypothetical protein